MRTNSVLGIVAVGFVGLVAVAESSQRLQTVRPVQPGAVTIIADSTFNPGDWTAIPVSVGGGTEANRQEATGGNAGAFRYMEHHLPSPPSITDVGRIQVAHFFEAVAYDPSAQGTIDHVDYFEDAVLLNEPYADAEMTSSAALMQGGRAFRSSSSQFLLLRSGAGWSSGALPGLTADDFVALDGSGDRPDFSSAGDSITFGYWRTNSRVGDLPVPFGEDLLFQHGIDNFSVTVHPLDAVICTIDPPSATRPRSHGSHVLTVTVTDGGIPVGDISLLMSASGANVASASGTTDVDGRAILEHTPAPIALGTDRLTVIGVHRGLLFECTGQVTWTNVPPVAVDDVVVVEADDTTATMILVLSNDFDPDGDELELIRFTQPLTGRVSRGGLELEYRIGSSLVEAFAYTISDGVDEDDAQVTVLHDCGCTLTCSDAGGKISSSRSDDLDLTLVRRFRDEVLQPTEHGARYTDIYYRATTEIALLLILRQPELGAQAVRMIEELQPALRSAVEGDGGALITQAQMDSVAAFFDNLSAAGSDSLRQLIADEMARLGPLDGFADRPVGEVLTTVLGDVLGTSIEDEEPVVGTDRQRLRNFPNPFAGSTEIQYVLPDASTVLVEIFNVRGQRVRTLVQTDLGAGTHVARWHGLDDDGITVPAGVYLVRLQTPTFRATKAIVFRP